MKLEGITIKLFERWLEQILFQQSSRGLLIKLTECGLDYILILIKFKGFFIKLVSLMDNLAIHARSDGREIPDDVAQIVFL